MHASIDSRFSFFQDGSHDVISRRKVLPSGQCTCSVRPASASAYAPACTCSYAYAAASAGYPLAILSTVPVPDPCTFVLGTNCKLKLRRSYDIATYIAYGSTIYQLALVQFLLLYIHCITRYAEIGRGSLLRLLDTLRRERAYYRPIGYVKFVCADYHLLVHMIDVLS